ncbi:ZP domain-containing protein-like isoform X2 [Actinia tenebrosa]|uniref:ZP domain-containing protein-like isoform X2 n=1 Tax=Actinia tenebrosa TaxID=6105 RepID=A0A6P8IJ34_ACTTE|nr:ZP domain-containing protein-like isoform X2 [Actinia tenebrosa]
MVASVWLPIFGLLILASFSSAGPLDCGEGNWEVEITGTKPGEIYSPNFPTAYPANRDCTWKIKAPLGNLIRVTITNLNLANGDTLTFSDGETAFPGNRIGQYSNCMDGKLPLFSTGSNMLVHFKSNAAGEDKGFKLTFKIVKKSKVESAGKVERTCSPLSRVSGDSGYIAHQEFPDSLSKQVQCSWEASVPSGKRIFSSFKMFGIGDKKDGYCSDYVLRHNFQGSATAGRYFCGCKLPNNIASTTNVGFYKFATYKNDQIYPGFLAYYKGLDPGTCVDQKSCSQLEDDRNVGFDRNGNILFERKTVTTTPPPTTAPKKAPVKPFQVNCKKDEIEIVLNITKYPELQHQSATLSDSSCKASHTNATHVFIRTALDECGTTHNYSSDGRYIIYHNEILIQKKALSKGESSVITRDHEAAFVFECKYHRSVVMSVVHFTPARAKVYTRTENFGNFTYEMEMFKSEKYDEAHDKYPVTVLANQRVYFQTKVVANDTDLVLLVENCKVTPSKDINDKEFYVIIEKGCERDETLKYNHKLSPFQRFSFNAFYFEADREATIHLHCKVRVCRRADKKSRCVEGCPYSKRRRRSEGVESEDISGTLMVGPLEIRDRGASSGRPSSPESRTMIVEVLIGVLGFIVMLLVVAVIFVVVKHQRRPKKLSLIVDDN